MRRVEARFRTKVIQRDYYFTPPQLKSIEEGSILRIREETSQGEKRRVLLSYKTPNALRTGVETREETEVEVIDDVPAARKLLEKLESKPLVSVTKEREEYALKFEGTSFTVTLDRVENLGSFVEIELVSHRKQDANHLIKLGESIAAKLGIDPSKKVTLGYHEMMLEKKQTASSYRALTTLR